jgi:hypothetical protein
MENIKEEENSAYSSDMKLGFAFFKVENLEPFQNFLKKIEIDEDNEKLTMTFTKFEANPIIFDFKNQKMTLPSNRQKPFDKFMTVTFEYCRESKSVLIKTFSYNNKHLDKGMKRIKIEDLKNIKLTNFLNIYSENYFKTSKKLIENNSSYIIPIPDFYKPCFNS